MIGRVLDRLVHLVLLLALVPVALVSVVACKPCPAAITAYADTGDDTAWKEFLKGDKRQAGPKDKTKNEPDGGVKGKGSGGGKQPKQAPCPPGKGTGGKDGARNPNLLGANGTQVASKSLMPRRKIAKEYSFRLDVENPNPGKVAGNIHVQVGGSGSTKYYWRGGTTFTSDKFEQLPKAARDYITNNPTAIERAINQGRKVLGEK